MSDGAADNGNDLVNLAQDLGCEIYLPSDSERA